MIDPGLIIECSANAVCSVGHAVVMSLILFVTLMGGFAYTTLLERRLVAAFQHRVGPNRVGIGGLAQPIADGIKLITKEDVTPASADKVIFWLAPAIKVVPTLIVLAVVPLGPPLLLPWFDGHWYRVPLGLADVNVGVLWILAITSISTYGIVLAGWASANKYAMLGGLRASAQMISYELSMGLAIVVPIMIVGSMSIGDIIEAQASPPILGWFAFQNPLAAGILLVAMLAETNRAPFDMPEAESELTGGYHTEYSGMKFALFFAAEYISMITISAIVAALFFGGYYWPIPLVEQAPILGPINVFIKVVVFLALFVWVRATLPRIRYDRLMAFGWKVMLPLSLLAVAWSAVSLALGDLTADPNTYMIVAGIVFGVVLLIVLVGLWQRGQPERRPEMTDARAGLGWLIVQVIGALVAPPFAVYDWLTQRRREAEEFVDDLRRQREEAEAARIQAAAPVEPPPGAAEAP